MRTLVSFMLLSVIVSCSNNNGDVIAKEESSVIDQSENDQSKDIEKKILPSFRNDGGSIPIGEIVPKLFCDMYLSADSFVYGSIKSIEMTQDNFVNVDRNGHHDLYSENSVDPNQCSFIGPSLRIEIEVINFYSGYDFKYMEKVYLYIGGDSYYSMKPMPSPDLRVNGSETELVSNRVKWYIDGEECSEYCALDVDSKIGFFANKYERIENVWYLSESLLWGDSSEFSMLDNNILLSNISNKKNIDEIIQSIYECEGYSSEEIERRRSNPDIDYSVSNYVLPKCYIR